MKDPLEVATKHYFWKPMMGYFQAFELRAYQRSVSFPVGLALDLGCGDGTFAEMLKELLELRHTTLIGADRTRARLLRAARRKSVYRQVVQLDAACLPFRDRTFDSVFSNAVLYCLNPNPQAALREIQRVLKSGREFVCTVPTHLAEQHYSVAESLRKLGLRRLERLYRGQVSRRLGGFVSALAPDVWCRLMQESGLIVQKVVPYISDAVSRRWSLLTATPLRAIGALKLVPWKRLHRAASAIEKRLMMRSFRDSSIASPGSGGDYILIVSKKPDEMRATQAALRTEAKTW